MSDPIDMLERLADLRDQGVLTEAEFQREKAETLAASSHAVAPATPAGAFADETGYPSTPSIRSRTTETKARFTRGWFEFIGAMPFLILLVSLADMISEGYRADWRPLPYLVLAGFVVSALLWIKLWGAVCEQRTPASILIDSYRRLKKTTPPGGPPQRNLFKECLLWWAFATGAYLVALALCYSFVHAASWGLSRAPILFQWFVGMLGVFVVLRVVAPISLRRHKAWNLQHPPTPLNISPQVSVAAGEKVLPKHRVRFAAWATGVLALCLVVGLYLGIFGNPFGRGATVSTDTTATSEKPIVEKSPVSPREDLVPIQIVTTEKGLFPACLSLELGMYPRLAASILGAPTRVTHPLATVEVDQWKIPIPTQGSSKKYGLITITFGYGAQATAQSISFVRMTDNFSAEVWQLRASGWEDLSPKAASTP